MLCAELFAFYVLMIFAQMTCVQVINNKLIGMDDKDLCAGDQLSSDWYR
jgi:hypothetical protein